MLTQQGKKYLSNKLGMYTYLVTLTNYVHLPGGINQFSKFENFYFSELK